MAEVLEAAPANLHMSIQQARPATDTRRHSPRPLAHTAAAAPAALVVRAAPRRTATAPAAHPLLPEPN